MSPYQQKSKKNDNLVGFIFIGAAAVLIFFASLQEESVITLRPSDNHISANSPEAEAAVNRHLLSTNRQIELQQQLKRIENFNSTPKVGDQVFNPGSNYPIQAGVVMGTDRRDQQRLKDGESARRQQDFNNPSNVVQREMANDQAVARDLASAKEEYARQFVENARKDGWAIELDDDYVVRSVKKIKDNKPRLYGPDQAGSQ